MTKIIKETVQTTTRAHTVERLIRTSKCNLYRRLDSLKQDRIVGNPTDNQYCIPSVAVENRTTKLWMRHELLNI